MTGYVETDVELEERLSLSLGEDVRSLGWARERQTFLGTKLA